MDTRFFRRYRARTDYAKAFTFNATRSPAHVHTLLWFGYTRVDKERTRARAVAHRFCARCAPAAIGCYAPRGWVCYRSEQAALRFGKTAASLSLDGRCYDVTHADNHAVVVIMIFAFSNAALLLWEPQWILSPVFFWLMPGVHVMPHATPLDFVRRWHPDEPCCETFTQPFDPHSAGAFLP